MKHILGISDTHLTSPEFGSKSLFPKFFDRLSLSEAERVYEQCRQIIEDVHDDTLDQLQAAGRWDILIHFGDVTGGYRERGLHHSSVAVLAEKVLGRYRHMANEVGMCWGNHDTGYSDIEGGLSAQSVDVCHKLSPLFWHKELDELLFVGICTPLLASYTGEDSAIIRQYRREQEDFIAETLRTNAGRRWVFCTHDLEISGLERIIAPYTSDLVRCMYGDRHVPLAESLIWTLGIIQPFGISSLCKRRSRLCPSVAPLGWRGGGALLGTWDGVEFALRRTQINVSPYLERDAKRLPFSSTANFLRWVIHAHVG